MKTKAERVWASGQAPDIIQFSFYTFAPGGPWTVQLGAEFPGEAAVKLMTFWAIPIDGTPFVSVLRLFIFAFLI
jgi:hypothetical protein